MTQTTFILLIIGTVCAAAGQLMFKAGADGRAALVEFLNGWILLGFVLYGIGTVCWIFALSRLRLTIVYPFTVLTFVFVYLGSWLIFKEQITVLGFCGVILVLFGLFLITAQ